MQPSSRTRNHHREHWWTKQFQHWPKLKSCKTNKDSWQVGHFLGKKYHTEVTDRPKPAIHPPRSIPHHILPFYKSKLDKMKADGIIMEVTEPTDWVKSSTYRIARIKEGEIIKLAWPKKLKWKHKESPLFRIMDDILPLLHGKKFFHHHWH